MIIFLIGMPGSGKSTVGKLLAEKLNWDFADMDSAIEKETGKTVQEIFDKDGEKQFRFMERQLLRMLVEKDSQVIATGGGVPVHNDNMLLIKSAGVSFYLKKSVEKLIENLGEDLNHRPLLKGKAPEIILNELLAAREPTYLQADHIIESDAAADAVERIIELIRD